MIVGNISVFIPKRSTKQHIHCKTFSLFYSGARSAYTCTFNVLEEVDFFPIDTQACEQQKQQNGARHQLTPTISSIAEADFEPNMTSPMARPQASPEIKKQQQQRKKNMLNYTY